MTNRRVLFLSSVMLRGYGVSVVAHEIAARIGPYGWDMVVGCMLSDDTYRCEGVVELAADPNAVATFCRENGIEAVVAQTTPYFEILPALASEFPTIVFEHGDPSPHFFDQDGEERQRIRINKIENVYPSVSKVLASSHFLRHDIEWLSAAVVPLGCDHVPDLGPKDLTMTAHRLARPLRVGTLMRLGEGESKYKGVDLFADLVEKSRGRDGIEFAIMGRGTDADRDRWESLGVEVHLNATDEERSVYLRDLDVLVSPSMWEGFNLPLVEAQASGTVGVAFDIGAHPETTPFLASSLDDLTLLLRAWNNNRDPSWSGPGTAHTISPDRSSPGITPHDSSQLTSPRWPQLPRRPRRLAPFSRESMRVDGCASRGSCSGAARVVLQRGGGAVKGEVGRLLGRERWMWFWVCPQRDTGPCESDGVVCRCAREDSF